MAAETAPAVLALPTGMPWLTSELEIWRWRSGLPVGAVPDTAEPHGLEMAGNSTGAAMWWEDRGCGYDAALALASGDRAAQRRALELLHWIECSGCSRPGSAMPRSPRGSWSLPALSTIPCRRSCRSWAYVRAPSERIGGAHGRRWRWRRAAARLDGHRRRGRIRVIHHLVCSSHVPTAPLGGDRFQLAVMNP